MEEVLGRKEKREVGKKKGLRRKRIRREWRSQGSKRVVVLAILPKMIIKVNKCKANAEIRNPPIRAFIHSRSVGISLNAIISYTTQLTPIHSNPSPLKNLFLPHPPGLFDRCRLINQNWLLTPPPEIEIGLNSQIQQPVLLPRGTPLVLGLRLLPILCMRWCWHVLVAMGMNMRQLAHAYRAIVVPPLQRIIRWWGYWWNVRWRGRRREDNCRGGRVRRCRRVW